ncbi:hypothetical protein V2J09_022418 [Rumex salicifolius]
MEDDEMQHLLSMGFPADLAAQALAATGGSSVDSAATNTSSPSQSHQPKLERFFNFHLNPPSSSLTPKSDTPPDTSLPKHWKLSLPPPQSPPPQLSPPNLPLAERIHPRSIDEVIGQDHILGQTSPLRSLITCNQLPSMVLWGPPGTEKTSIARVIVVSMASQYQFVSLSVVTSGVKDVRGAVDEARKHRMGKNGKKTVLFVDEVHRFNNSQQDSFLHVIEDGSIVFIGATTENPSFHLITPLLSRSRVLTVNPLGIHDISTLLTRTGEGRERSHGRSKEAPRGKNGKKTVLFVDEVHRFNKSQQDSFLPVIEDRSIVFIGATIENLPSISSPLFYLGVGTLLTRVAGDLERGLSVTVSIGVKLDVEEEAIQLLSSQCDEDARVGLNALEVSAIIAEARVKNRANNSDAALTLTVTVEDAKEAMQCKHLGTTEMGKSTTIS